MTRLRHIGKRGYEHWNNFGYKSHFVHLDIDNNAEVLLATKKRKICNGVTDFEEEIPKIAGREDIELISILNNRQGILLNLNDDNVDIQEEEY